MKNRLIKVLKISLIMVFIFNITVFSVAAANEDLKVVVNGESVNFPDAKPFINKDDRTLVPVRFIAENLGCQVEWNGEIRQVGITNKDKQIKLDIDGSGAYVNEEKITFDTKAIIEDDRTFVPLRFISEALGAKVEWNGESRTVFITRKNDSDKTEKDDEDRDEEQKENDFIEPEFEIIPSKFSSNNFHCSLHIKNSNEYEENEDEYKVRFIVLDNNEMNSYYDQPMNDWIEIDLTKWKNIDNKAWWQFRKVYLKEKDWDGERFKTEVGMKVKVKIILRNETKEIEKEYVKEITATKSLKI